MLATMPVVLATVIYFVLTSVADAVVVIAGASVVARYV